MKTVTFDIANSDGSPRELGIVVVRLVAGTPGAVVGGQVRLDEVEVHLDDLGQGEVDLATNDVEVIDPVGTYYTATVKGSSPTVYRCFELTDDLPDTVPWTYEAMQLAAPAMPDVMVSSDRVRASPVGVFDPATLHDAVFEAVVQLFPEESEAAGAAAEIVASQIVGQVDLVDLSDPDSLTNLLANAAEIAAHAVAGTGLLGLNLVTVSAALARAIYINPNPPGDTSVADYPERSLWVRTPGDLRAFVDFRLFPDGPIDGATSNGVGSIQPPPTLRSFTEIYPPFGGVDAVVTDGVVRSSGAAVPGDDPTPRTGFTFEGVAPGDSGRIEWGFGGYTDTGATFTTYSPTNVAISAPFDDLPEGAAGPDAYLAGFVVGRFVGDTDATDPGQPVSMRCKLIRDDLGAPTTIGSGALPRMPIKGVDRIGFTWNADGELAVLFNGEVIATATDTTHDITTFTGIGMVMHQGSDGDHTWEDAWYCGVEWFGISAGDEITGDLGAHVWTDEAGWQPVGPGARPVLGAGGGGGGLDEAAVQALIDSAVAALLDGAPGALDTLNELAAALGDDASFAASVTTALAGKVGTGDARLTDTRTPTDGSVTVAKLASAVLDKIGRTVETTSDSAARTSTTYTADGVLEFAGAADTTYKIDQYAIFQGDAASDLKVGFTIPGGTMHLTVEGALTSVASGSDYDRFLTLTSSGATTVVGIAGPSTPIAVRISGVIHLTSAGTVSFGWAPNGSGGSGVTRLARSQLFYRAA